MSKGGGGGPTHTTSDVTQSNLPEYARPYYQDLMARAGYESAVPYTPYAGSRLAMFSPQEQTAMDRISALGVSGTGPELDTQAMIAGQVGSRIFNISGYQPSKSSPPKNWNASIWLLG